MTYQVLLTSIMTTIWHIAAAVAVVLWILTGISFLYARGDPEKLKISKKAVIAAVAGTAIMVLAYSMTSIMEKAFEV